jgi:DNA polymerase-3 subunit epsilon
MIDQKVCWVDVETTGLHPGYHGIIQLAVLIEVEMKIVEERDWKVRPLLEHRIDQEALDLRGLKEPQIKNWQPSGLAFKELEALLGRFVSRFKKEDKFVLAGYNINSFDEPFLREFFKENAASKRAREAGGWFGSYFFWPKRDIQTYLSDYITERGLRLENYKLETVCEHFGIEIDAHDALSDIRATRALYYALRYSNLAGAK